VLRRVPPAGERDAAPTQQATAAAAAAAEAEAEQAAAAEQGGAREVDGALHQLVQRLGVVAEQAVRGVQRVARHAVARVEGEDATPLAA
jgi:hypothetical protein